MPTVSLYNQEGKTVGNIELSDNVFAVKVNPSVLHHVVRVQLANKRQGTQSALTRAEVSGGGRKPWRQKGTGRARQGSTRSPQWRHGGIVFAPKPRDYSMTVQKKVKRLAIRGALSSKVEDGTIMVLDKLALEAPKTKLVAGVLKALSVTTKALLVTKDKDEAVYRAGRNIEGLKVTTASTLSVLDILGYDRFIVTQDAARYIEEVFA